MVMKVLLQAACLESKTRTSQLGLILKYLVSTSVQTVRQHRAKISQSSSTYQLRGLNLDLRVRSDLRLLSIFLVQRQFLAVI